MIALFGVIGLACLVLFSLCVALGTVAGNAVGALGGTGRDRNQALETSYWSIR